MKPERCAAIAASGQPCSAVPRPGRPYCLWHDPDAAEARREISRKGGAGRSNRARARKQIGTDALTLEEMRGLLSLATRGVLAGRMEPSVLNAVANASRAMSELVKTTEHEELIRQLEEAAAMERRHA